jgi:hypothetical protein
MLLLDDLADEEEDLPHVRALLVGAFEEVAAMGLGDDERVAGVDGVVVPECGGRA